jgi:hypothetical protein
MNEAQAAEILAAHNAWRRQRSDDELPLLPMQDPKAVGVAIDVAAQAMAEYCELSDRHEVQAQNYMALAAECEQLRADAARYRYLRSHPERVSVAVVVQGHWLPAIGEQLDRAVDAAMKETK